MISQTNWLSRGGTSLTPRRGTLPTASDLTDASDEELNMTNKIQFLKVSAGAGTLAPYARAELTISLQNTNDSTRRLTRDSSASVKTCQLAAHGGR